MRARLFPWLMLLILATAPAPAAEVVRVGILSYRGNERAVSGWSFTLQYLANALPEYDFQIVPGDLASLAAKTAAHQIDFVITNPGQYVELETEYGAARIATAETAGGSPPAAADGATLFALASRSDLRDFANLRGRRLAATAAETFSFRQVWRELAEQGINPWDDLAALKFQGFPADRVVDAVRRGEADVGVVRACVIEQMAKEGLVSPGEFHVLAAQRLPAPGCLVSTRLYPDWPFARLATTSEEMAKKVAQALLAMPAAANGQNWTVPVDYQTVHDLYRDLKIPPYGGLKQRSLGDILWDNRHWLALLGLAFLWWVGHVLRVQYLIRKRTGELRAANDEARSRREELQHAARLSLVGEMAGCLAHELNQPLAAILNYARGCERRLVGDSSNPEILHAVRQIAAQAERGGEIVRHMRDFVRKRPPARRLIDPAPLFAEAVSLFTPIARRRGIEVRLEQPSGLPTLSADPVQVEEVLLNLLQNAADAVSGRHPAEILVTVAVEKDGLLVEVADNGPGIDAAIQDRLFQAFATTKPDGLGLGLSLCRGIIESHGGRLHGENRDSGGAIFRFTLPVTPEKTDA